MIQAGCGGAATSALNSLSRAAPERLSTFALTSSLGCAASQSAAAIKHSAGFIC
jgi:hypothetical protein